jgi:signal transduction histidine kinase
MNKKDKDIHLEERGKGVPKRRIKKDSPEVRPPSPEEDQEFLFKTFHDMRNPLHAILGYSSLVLRKTRELIPEKHQENLEKVIESAEKLKEMVDQLVNSYRKK